MPERALFSWPGRRGLGPGTRRWRLRARWAIAPCFVAAALSGWTPRAHAAGEIVQIPPLIGETSSIPMSINAAGTVVGYSYNRPFAWSATGGSTELTQVQSIIDATDINDAGSIIGREWWQGHDWQGYFWNPSTGQSDLGSLGGIRTEPAAVNNHGTVVGQSVTTGFVDHAFRWTAAGGMQDLGALGGFNASSTATDVSDTEVIVGRTGYVGHAFRWTAAAGMSDLGTLGGDFSTAMGISRDGKTIVGSADDPAGATGPFRWTQDQGMQGLATLGGVLGAAYHVNDAGAAVGWTTDALGYEHAVLWTAAQSQPIDLSAWLASVDPAAAADWHLQELVDINNAGQITGYGNYFPGAVGTVPLRAFVLDVSSIPGAAVPEPALGGAAIGLGAAAWAGCSRRRRR